MRFAALRDRLPSLPTTGEPLGNAWPKIGRGGTSFSDDLALGDRARLGVRVRITDRAQGGYCIDLRDCDDASPDHRFGLSTAQAMTACVLAIGDALGQTPHAGWSERVELLTDPRTWVGGTDSPDPAAVLFGLARTYDTVLGALGNAWPGKVGAGSCTLGAVVELRDADANAETPAVLTEVLPGGEGGQPTRPGRTAYPGPIVAAPWPPAPTPTLDGIEAEANEREGSGGMGKQSGGHGVVRRYRVQRPLVARLAFDRIHNPPHGIERAGPPEGTVVSIEAADGCTIAVEPWTDYPLAPGSCLTVMTCGGAGWGFPGYGEIEWDPTEWFGSQSARPPEK